MMFLTKYKVKTSANIDSTFFLSTDEKLKQQAMTGNISKFDSIFLVVCLFFGFAQINDILGQNCFTQLVPLPER